MERKRKTVVAGEGIADFIKTMRDKSKQKAEQDEQLSLFEQDVINQTQIVQEKEHQKPQENLPVLVDEQDKTLLYQPTEVTFMNAKLETALEWHILTLVVEQLQNFIKKSIEAKKNRNSIQLIFDEFQGNQEKQILTLKFKDLNISRANYPKVREVLLKMQQIIVDFQSKDPISGENCTVYTGFFDEVYETKKMDRVFRVRMKEKVMERFIEITNQYTPYFKEVVLNLKKKHSIKLYLLMSTMAYKKKFSYTEAKLRAFLGIKKDQYKKQSDFFRILNKAQKDILQEKGLAFSYEYQPQTDISQAGFVFTVKKISKKITKQQEKQKQINVQIIRNLLTTHFGINELEFLKIEEKITLDNYEALLLKITELKKYISKNYKSIKSINEYTLKSIDEFFKEISDVNL